MKPANEVYEMFSKLDTALNDYGRDTLLSVLATFASNWALRHDENVMALGADLLLMLKKHEERYR